MKTEMNSKNMFEEYTPEARRSMFFAHAAARQLGSQMIETGHLLLGLVRENIALVNRFLNTEATENSFRGQITANAVASGVVPTGLEEMPFTDESKRVLAFAAEEADRMGHHVGIEHLLLGLMREPDSVACRMLRERGADTAQIRKELATSPHKPPPKEERALREIDEIRLWADAQTRAFPNSPKVDRNDNVFGRYTVKADRLIFFAKHVASRLGSPVVETEHLLLSILREEKDHFALFVPLAHSRETICSQIEEQVIVRKTVVSGAERCAPGEDLPLSDECKRVLDYADEEATLLGSERIGPEHLLLGMLREESSDAARILRERGAELDRIRRGLAA